LSKSRSSQASWKDYRRTPILQKHMSRVKRISTVIKFNCDLIPSLCAKLFLRPAFCAKTRKRKTPVYRRLLNTFVDDTGDTAIPDPCTVDQRSVIRESLKSPAHPVGVCREADSGQRRRIEAREITRGELRTLLQTAGCPTSPLYSVCPEL
jgi:hypothetical protein